ncbi:MAG TPA: hypothetical protein VFN55_07825 [Solirubrobacteraceae bacterium]|nr:hypothetical protein [Solirubrobacteraceae bacterium]
MKRHLAARSPPAVNGAFVIAAVIVALDQLSKALAVDLLAGRGVVSVLGGLVHLSLYCNFASSGNRLAAGSR